MEAKTKTLEHDKAGKLSTRVSLANRTNIQPQKNENLNDLWCPYMI